MINYGFWVPVGGETSLGYWTHQLQLGSTVFVDEEKAWSLSAMGTYEINGRNASKNYTKGNYFTAEWGVVKNLDPNVTLGLVGYGTWQVGDDTGAGLRLAYHPVRDYAYGIGGELKVTFPEANFLSVGLKHVRDIGSFGRLSGPVTTLTLSIPIEMELPTAPPAADPPSAPEPAPAEPQPQPNP